MARVVLSSKVLPYEESTFYVDGADKVRCSFSKRQTQRAIQELELTRKDDLDNQVWCKIETTAGNPAQDSSCWFDEETGLIWVSPPGAIG
jgi:hypothetical protein